jgi:hypothetical protein
MQVQQRQHLGHLRRLARPGRQDRRRKPAPLASHHVEALVIDPRGAHRHPAGGGEHGPFLVAAIAHHQSMPVVIDLVDELGDIGRNLGLQRRRQHLAGTIADDLIEQRPPRTKIVVVGGFGIVNYREHGRTFPNQRANAGS